MEQITSPTTTQAPQTEAPATTAGDRRAERAQRHAAALEASHLLRIRSR
jgi:hypothetical protein